MGAAVLDPARGQRASRVTERFQPVPATFHTGILPSREALRVLGVVRISAKSDYALRAATELAAAGGGPVKGEALANGQGIPQKFLENILSDLRQAGIVRSQRGAEGGYWLARPAGEVTVADVIRAVDGPLASVRGQRPEDVEYSGAAEALQTVWIAVRASLRGVTEHVTLEHLVNGELPAEVVELTNEPEAWRRR